MNHSYFICLVILISSLNASAQGFGIQAGFDRMKALPSETQGLLNDFNDEISQQLLCGHEQAANIYLKNNTAEVLKNVAELKVVSDAIDALVKKLKDYQAKNLVQQLLSADSEESIVKDILRKKEEAAKISIRISIDAYRFNTDLTELLMWSIFTYRDLIVGNPVSSVRFDWIEKYAKNLGCDLRKSASEKNIKRYNELAASIQPKLFDDYAARGLSIRFVYSLLKNSKLVQEQYIGDYLEEQGYGQDIEKSNAILPEIKALNPKK